MNIPFRNLLHGDRSGRSGRLKNSESAPVSIRPYGAAGAVRRSNPRSMVRSKGLDRKDELLQEANAMTDVLTDYIGVIAAPLVRIKYYELCPTRM